MSAYVTIDELRDEGVAATITDAQLLRVIRRASALIDAWTHQWFEPRAMTMLLDGTGSDTLLIGPAIISISQIRILERDGSVNLVSPLEDITLDRVRVYNRHLQGLTDPDDRNNPKIQFVSSALGMPHRVVDRFASGWWQRGVQNVELTGFFGYTDPDPDETVVSGGFPHGKTPEAIKLACLMLVVRDMLPLSDVEGRTDAALAGRVTRLRTRDQEIAYSSSNSSTGGTSVAASAGSGIFGNVEIMTLLAPYCRRFTLGSV